MFNIAIIRKNLVGLDKTKLSDKQNAKNYLKDIVKEYVEFKDVSTLDNMMSEIINVINMPKEKIGDTTFSVQTKDSFYQICHYNLKNNASENKEEDINYLCCFMAKDKEKIYGDSVLIKSTLAPNELCNPAKMDIDEIVDLLYKKMLPACVHLKCEDNTAHEMRFFNDPVEECLGDDILNYHTQKINIVGHDLIMFYKKKTDGPINKKATRLSGKKVRGDTLVLYMESDHDFGYFGLELFRNISNASYGNMDDREVTPKERKEDEKIGEVPIVLTKWKILQNRLEKNGNNCFKCSNEITDGNNMQTCTGCYRYMYCSKGCQLQDWPDHRNDCNHKEDFIN
jgi:hypothetical protein